jgi:hypothetical protein
VLDGEIPKKLRLKIESLKADILKQPGSLVLLSSPFDEANLATAFTSHLNSFLLLLLCFCFGSTKV